MHTVHNGRVSSSAFSLMCFKPSVASWRSGPSIGTSTLSITLGRLPLGVLPVRFVRMTLVISSRYFSLTMTSPFRKMSGLLCVSIMAYSKICSSSFATGGSTNVHILILSQAHCGRSDGKFCLCAISYTASCFSSIGMLP